MIRRLRGGCSWPGYETIMVMRQLQFFTREELAGMRDRTRSRRYSPTAEEFRRTHEQHRDWGLIQRHNAKRRRLNSPAGLPVPSPQDPTPSPPAKPPVKPSPAPAIAPGSRTAERVSPEPQGAVITAFPQGHETDTGQAQVSPPAEPATADFGRHKPEQRRPRTAPRPPIEPTIRAHVSTKVQPVAGARLPTVARPDTSAPIPTIVQPASQPTNHRSACLDKAPAGNESTRPNDHPVRHQPDLPRQSSSQTHQGSCLDNRPAGTRAPGPTIVRSPAQAGASTIVRSAAAARVLFGPGGRLDDRRADAAWRFPPWVGRGRSCERTDGRIGRGGTVRRLRVRGLCRRPPGALAGGCGRWPTFAAVPSPAGGNFQFPVWRLRMRRLPVAGFSNRQRRTGCPTSISGPRSTTQPVAIGGEVPGWPTARSASTPAEPGRRCPRTAHLPEAIPGHPRRASRRSCCQPKRIWTTAQ
jgi:hypothetical protein